MLNRNKVKLISSNVTEKTIGLKRLYVCNIRATFSLSFICVEVIGCENFSSLVFSIKCSSIGTEFYFFCIVANTNSSKNTS